MLFSRLPPPLITLTTDFGLADTYVGVMKGVMYAIALEASSWVRSFVFVFAVSFGHTGFAPVGTGLNPALTPEGQ